MEPVTFTFMNNLGVIAAGLVATGVMTAFVLSFTWAGLLATSSIEAVGTLMSTSTQNARRIGYGVHAFIGVIFAFVYAIVMAATGFTTGAWPILAGVGMGIIHGYVVSFIVIIEIAEHHPMAEFRENGPAMGAMYFAAHVIYGGVLGAMLQLLLVFG